MQNTIENTTGAGAIAAHFIEWGGGYGEQFFGTVAEAEARIISESGADGDIMKKHSEHGYDLFEWRIRPHGEDWFFLGRIYCTIEGESMARCR